VVTKVITKTKTYEVEVPVTKEYTKEFHYFETITKTLEKPITTEVEVPRTYVKEETKTITSPVAVQSIIPAIPYEITIMIIVLIAIAMGSLTALVAKSGKSITPEMK
jgi:hypothetical protein